MTLLYFYSIASCTKRFQLLLGEVNDCADWRVSDCNYAKASIGICFCVNVMLARFFVTNYNKERYNKG